LRLAQQAARIGVFEWNIQTGRNVWTPELEALHGMRPGEFSQRYPAWEELIHPEDRAATLQLTQQSIQSGELTIGEWRVVWPDGSVHWLASRWQVFKDANGQPLRMTGVNLDITERKRAEEGLKKAKEELEVRVQERTEELARSQNRLQHLASQLLMAQEKERKRVAVELHDGLMSELAATKFLLEGKIMLLDKGEPINSAELRRIADVLAGTMKEARRVMNNLHPSILDELGLIATIGWLCGEYKKSYPQITVQQEIAVSEKDIAEEIKVVIYRVLQEALNNFARHGKGDRMEVALFRSVGTFSFVIRDNGQGFDVENAQKGLGLESMRERVELSGGEFQIESTIGQGTTIRAIWSR
jgi:PAS domain S-box-containing protein